MGSGASMSNKCTSVMHITASPHIFNLYPNDVPDGMPHFGALSKLNTLLNTYRCSKHHGAPMHYI
jgi:hypothetical protein